ncbi:MAG: ABC transporter substrate-binding protein, partial [Patescibacteria group bacterium]
MKEIFSLFKQRAESLFLKIRFIVRALKTKEKVAFAIFILLFFTGIIGLLGIMNDLIAVEVPIDGGVLYEGIIGFPRFINPLIAASEADRDLTELIYAGLLKSDGQGGLKPELAEKYEISEDNLAYTFFLKENLRWSDGQPITAQDIAFTVKLVQDPSLKSP